MTLVDSTQEQIKQLILEKKYDNRGFLPSEGELCRMLEVSRSTMREAVRAMEVRGFVKRIQGKGIRVVNESIKVLTRSLIDMISVDEISDEDFLEVRRMIEIPIASLAAERAGADDIAALHHCVKVMEESRQIDEEYLQAEYEFHRCLAASTGNKLLISFLAATHDSLQHIICSSLDRAEDLESEHHYHREILEAVASRNPENSARLMSIHLQAAEHNVRDDEV